MMYHYCLFGILLLWNTTAVANATAIDQWELQLALHKTLETALLSPLNLFQLSEVFFPRKHDIISPVSVQITYILTCPDPRKCSENEMNSFCNIALQYLWTSLPIHRSDCFTISILESFSQKQLVELSLKIGTLPCGTSLQGVKDELLNISAMVSNLQKVNSMFYIR